MMIIIMTTAFWHCFGQRASKLGSQL